MFKAFGLFVLLCTAVSCGPSTPQVGVETWDGHLIPTGNPTPIPLRLVVKNDQYYTGTAYQGSTTLILGSVVGQAGPQPSFSIWTSDLKGQYVIWGKRRHDDVTGTWEHRRAEAGMPVDARGTVFLHLTDVHHVPDDD